MLASPMGFNSVMKLLTLVVSCFLAFCVSESMNCAVGTDVNRPPFVLAGHGIFVALPQEALAVGVFQIVDLRGVFAELTVVKLNGALVLLAAIHQKLFLIALGFKNHARQGGNRT